MRATRSDSYHAANTKPKPVLIYRNGEITKEGYDRLQHAMEDMERQDTDEFQERWMHISKRVFNFLLQQVQNRGYAEDLLQETYIGGLKNYGKLKNKDVFDNWIYKIARNRVFELWRSAEYRLAKESHPSSSRGNGIVAYKLQNIRSAYPDPLQDLVSSRFADALNSAFSTLSENDFCIYYSVVDKMSLKEIANITGKTVSAVKTDIYRGRKILKEYLSNLGFEPGIFSFRLEPDDFEIVIR
jgi:RNA polymerase sigma factor (sigma-70 family)